MDATEPIFRKTCATCDRPALTLDHAGVPRCAGHAETFIASDSVSIELDEAGLTVALIHRDLVIASRSRPFERATRPRENAFPS